MPVIRIPPATTTYGVAFPGNSFTRFSIQSGSRYIPPILVHIDRQPSGMVACAQGAAGIAIDAIGDIAARFQMIDHALKSIFCGRMNLSPPRSLPGVAGLNQLTLHILWRAIPSLRQGEIGMEQKKRKKKKGNGVFHRFNLFKSGFRWVPFRYRPRRQQGFNEFQHELQALGTKPSPKSNPGFFLLPLRGDFSGLSGICLEKRGFLFLSFPFFQTKK